MPPWPKNWPTSMLYALAFANSLQIDVAQAVLAKLAKNETRFPAFGGRTRR